MIKNHLQCGRPGFDPWVGKIPRRRAWQPTPVFLPGESHGQSSLEGYSPGVPKSHMQLRGQTTASKLKLYLDNSSSLSDCQKSTSFTQYFLVESVGTHISLNVAVGKGKWHSHIEGNLIISGKIM